MKKAFFFVMFLLTSAVAVFCWSATKTGIKSFIAWTAAGLQPHVNASSIILLAVISVILTVLAIVFFVAFRKARKKEELNGK